MSTGTHRRSALAPGIASSSYAFGDFGVVNAFELGGEEGVRAQREHAAQLRQAEEQAQAATVAHYEARRDERRRRRLAGLEQGLGLGLGLEQGERMAQGEQHGTVGSSRRALLQLGEAAAGRACVEGWGLGGAGAGEAEGEGSIAREREGECRSGNGSATSEWAGMDEAQLAFATHGMFALCTR